MLSGDDNIFNMPTVIDENNNKINDKKEKINIETTAEEPPAETASAKPSETTADKVDVAGKDKAEEKPADKAEEKPKEKAEEKPKPEKATRLKITEPLKSITKHGKLYFDDHISILIIMSSSHFSGRVGHLRVQGQSGQL